MADAIDDQARLGRPSRACRSCGPASRRSNANGPEPIAIVGIGCRFPAGASAPEAYWELLREGRDAVGEVPPDRWDVDALLRRRTRTPPARCTPRGGVPRRRSTSSTPQFFGISPREARDHGPAAAAAAGGGLGGAGARRPVAGAARRQRHRRLRRHLRQRLLHADHAARTIAGRSTRYWRTGNAQSVAAGRLSYVARPAGARPGGRHRLLVVAGGGPPGLPEPARAASATWRWPAA